MVNDMESNNKSITKGLFWKLLERFGVQGVQFVLQIILARLLDPIHYGALSIMIIFTTLANVFIQSGFNTALVQNKDVTEEDYSSVFWVTFFISIFLYIALFFAIPLIANYYNMPLVIPQFRVLALMIIPGSLNSIQLAKVYREMKFKKVFVSNIGAVLVAGLLGILLALNGFGIWSLVWQNIIKVVMATVIMIFTIKWIPKFTINFKRVKELFAYGWKILVSGLIDNLYQEVRSLIIGKKYSSDTLGYYDRGKQFPQFLITSINGAVQSVMLPAMSALQTKKEQVKELTRRSIKTCSYLIFPMMVGLAMVASPLVKILLTEKWLPCVIFLQIYCFTFAFYPIHTCNLQAINAMGRSDIFLTLEIIKKAIGVATLLVAVFCFHTPIAIAATGIITAITSSIINAWPNKKLLGYSYFEQLKDIFPSVFLSLVMGASVFLVGLIKTNVYLLLVLQVAVGVVVYVGLSYLTKNENFIFIVDYAKSILKRKGE